MNRFFSPISLLVLLLILVPLSSIADSVRLADDLRLEVLLPGERWEMSREPSEALLEDIVDHIHHELEGEGKEVPEEKIREAAKKRLAANELFLRSRTGAHVEIDVSPLRPGETPPSGRDVKTSAKYAGQGMEEEEGVSGAAFRVKKAEVPGAAIAYRLVVDYMQHGQKMKFVGIVGFEDPYWFYFYGTDPLSDERDGREMEQILSSIKLVKD